MNKVKFVLGIVLIVIAVILGAVQLATHALSIYGSTITKYGYYAVVGVVGLIGIIIAAWSSMKKQRLLKQLPKLKARRKRSYSGTLLRSLLFSSHLFRHSTVTPS